MSTRLIATFVLLVTQLFVASAALAADVTIIPSGGNTYDVQGIALDGVSGIQLEVIYDSTLLSMPTVSKGAVIGDALIAANTNVPGSIKLAIISTKPFSGNGSVATITFANRKGNGSVSIPRPATLIDRDGAAITQSDNLSSPSLSAQGVITTPGVPFSTQAPTSPAAVTTSQPTTVTAPVATTQTPTYLGTVTMPADTLPRTETRPVEPVVEAPPVQQPPPVETKVPEKIEPAPEKAVEPEKTVEIKQIVYSSILDRFRTYKGALSPAILMALFSKDIAPAIQQEPVISVSDGKTPLKVLYTSQSSEKAAPNFALTGAKMMGLKKEDDSLVWTLEALPLAGTTKASVTILTGSSIIEFPLTIVPPLNEAVANEPDFALFVKDAGAKTPKYDLNGDGVHDYQDNFIYTAHYLLKKAAPPEQKPKK